jgi:DNA-binding response OmpR family regulator
VLAANTPEEALRLAGEHTGSIQLLVTDVIMPGMNGRDLAKQIKTACPEVKCLFMSGYTADVIVHRGVLEEGTQFIQKPFSLNDLVARVRVELDRE